MKLTQHKTFIKFYKYGAVISKDLFSLVIFHCLERYPFLPLMMATEHFSGTSHVLSPRQ